MAAYTKVRLLFALAAIFVFVYMLDGMPCLGDANEASGSTSSIRILPDNIELSTSTLETRIGRSLVVPKLIASELDKINVASIFPSSLFEKVESIGRRHLSNEKTKGTKYVVREGDSLWSIASEQLGKGSRYMEINEMNADTLENEHDLTVGMTLYLPNR